MNIKFNLILLGLIAGIFSACEHSKVYDPTTQTTKDLVIPNGFDWEVSENVEFSVTSKVETAVNVFEDEACKILLATLPANDKVVEYNLNVPKGSTKLFVQYPSVDGTPVVLPASLVTTKADKTKKTTTVHLPEEGTGKWFEEKKGVIYYPALSRGWGTILFEDMWPELGDYDFNDVAVSYKIQLYTKEIDGGNAILVSVCLNGLGGNLPYQLCLQLDDVQEKYINEIEDYNTQEEKWIHEKNAEDSPAIFSFDWGKKKGMNGGKYFNTEKEYEVGASVVGATEISFIIYLKDEIDVCSLDLYSFNFFIRKSDGTEIHLKGYQPTEAFKDKYAEIVAEYEDLDPNNYYCTKKGFVWGIKAPTSINHPIEKTDMTKAYKNFGDWITSGGTKHKNWFEEEAGKDLRINVWDSKDK